MPEIAACIVSGLDVPVKGGSVSQFFTLYIRISVQRPGRPIGTLVPTMEGGSRTAASPRISVSGLAYWCSVIRFSFFQNRLLSTVDKHALQCSPLISIDIYPHLSVYIYLPAFIFL